VTAERGYPDDRWYADERTAGVGYEQEWDRRGHGVPEQRYGDEQPRRGGAGERYASLSELNGEVDRRRGDRSAVEQREQSWAPAMDAPPAATVPPPARETGGRETADRGALRRAADGPTRMAQEPPADGVYRTKRPAIAIGIGFAIGVLELAVARVFLAGLFGKVFDPRMTIAGGLFLIALPLFGLGLYALATGAARAVDVWGPRVWLRPPLAYLTVSIALMIAGGAAA
jgi:hypothetical protein